VTRARLPADAAEPTICVLMATHNGRAWVREQIDSILGQVSVQVHLIVSDDASTDGTAELIESIASHDSRVTLVRQPERLGSAASNFICLIQQAPIERYRLYALSDQDDVWHPDKLARHSALLRKHQVSAVSSDVTAFWPSGREALIRKSYPQRRWDYLFEPPGPGCTFLLTDEVILRFNAAIELLRMRNADLMVFHDWMIYVVARAHGLRWWIDNTPSLRYRQHGHNVVGAHVGWQASWVRLRKLACGEYRQQVLAAMATAKMANPASPDRLSTADLLLNGRRRMRDATMSALFMPLGIRLSAKQGRETSPGRYGRT
jgi:rhamnosyltransferase